MRTPAIAYITSLLVMGVLDAAWLSFATSRLYRPGIGHLMTDKPVIPAALLFYLGYAAGITYLVTLPALATGTLQGALIRGAALGLLAYGTYDLTNLATLQGWPMGVAVIDALWGGIITALTCGAAFWVSLKLR